MAWATNECNDYARKLKTSKEDEKRSLAKIDAAKYDLKDTRHEFEKTKCDFERYNQGTNREHLD